MDKCPKRDKTWVAAQRWVVKGEVHPAGLGGFHMPEGHGTAVHEADPVWPRKRYPMIQDLSLPLTQATLLSFCVHPNPGFP